MAVTFNKALRAHVDERPIFTRKASDYSSVSSDPFCASCGDQYPSQRLSLGFRVCLSCSKEKIVLANSALHKQGYTYERDTAALRINPYSTHK